MQSRNPVFANNDSFNARAATQTYSDPSTWQTGAPGHGGYATPPTSIDQGRMSVDSVVQKTAMTLGLLIAAAAVTWVLIGDMDTEGALGRAQVFAMGGAFIGLALSLVNSFKKVVSPPLVLAYAVVEGIFVGAMSKVFETVYDGVVMGAVLGTIAAFVGTLAAYKFLNIKVTDRFRKVVAAAMFGFVGLALLDFVLSMFSSGFGFNGLGTMGLISSIVGVVIAVFMLILDFDYVERGVAAGLPERESWRAAFGLTVTLVWLYIELLRILAIVSGRD